MYIRFGLNRQGDVERAERGEERMKDEKDKEEEREDECMHQRF